MKPIDMKYSLLLLALSLTPAAMAREIPDWIASAPGRERFPRTEALVLRHRVDLELLPDGRRRRHVLIAVKVLRQLPYNRQGLADPRIHYDSASQEIEVLQARVWTPAGRAKDTAENGINRVFPGALVKAPDLASFRDLVVTHVGICEGCVTLLEYRLTDTRPGGWTFEGGIPAQLPFPILDQRITLTAPKESGLQAHLVTLGETVGETTHKGENLDGLVRHTFTRKGLVPRAGEPVDMVFYTTTDKQEMARRLQAKMAEMGSLPPELAGRIEGASAHPERSIVRADRIARLLNKTLHLQAWPLDLLRFRVRPAHQVWESTYATLPELAGLLRLAFLQGGFKRARVVPITSRSGIDLAAPSEAESLWIAATWPGEDEIWLQVGGRPGRPGKAALLGASSLAGAPPEDLPRRGGVVSVTGHLRLTNEGNLQADLSLVLAGTAFNPELAALEGVENQLGNWGAQLGGAKVDKISLYELSGTRARARLRFSGGRCTRDKAGILQLELPLPPSSPALLLAGLHATKCRGLTRIPGGPWVEEVDLVLAEPHFADPVAVPPPLSVKNRLGSLSLVLERAGDTLRLRYRLALEQAVVPPGERPLLRALLAPLQRPGTRALIFRIPDGK